MDLTTQPQRAMIPTPTLKAETAQRQPNFRRDFMPYEPMENERSGQPNRGVRIEESFWRGVPRPSQGLLIRLLDDTEADGQRMDTLTTGHRPHMAGQVTLGAIT